MFKSVNLKSSKEISSLAQELQVLSLGKELAALRGGCDLANTSGTGGSTSTDPTEVGKSRTEGEEPDEPQPDTGASATSCPK